jgi:multidrug efflux system membrane fusion protein
VREIAPAVDASTRTFAVRVAIVAPDEDVKWGMTANVLAQGATDVSQAALVPSASIYHAEDGKPAVWIYDPAAGTVALRRVELDAFREDGALLASGVKDGEWIVAAGVHKLRAGQAVKPWESADVPTPTASAKPRA